MNNNQLTQEDYNNISILIAKAPITGKEAMTVALIQQKLTGLMTPSVKPQEAPEDGKTEANTKKK